ncbi:MAG TPA: HAMP domain-containing sensor histidine kinase [Acidimicrobiales bacterium]|nr:HAMP domain-containing sensor histidine kinase [Acidimicrobiales bacterium]
MRARDLPLFWKLLLPFLSLIVIFGSVGAFVIVRDLSARAQEALDLELARRSFESRSLAQNRELYLVESANFATNIQGMPAAVAAGDRRTTEMLLGSVLALKADVALLVATDDRGEALVELRRATPEAKPSAAVGGAWATDPMVLQVLRDRSGERLAGFLRDGDATLLVIAAPICLATTGCAQGVTGVALVGLAADRLIATSDARRAGSTALYDTGGGLLASSGAPTPAAPPVTEGDRLLRRSSRVDGTDVATLYAPFTVQGRRVGTLAASVPTGPAFDSVRGTGRRIGVIVLLVMVGVIGVGFLLSRSIVAQLRPLVATNRALGRGDLTARAPVVSNDELGELAAGVNQMAEQLEALYGSLELRVAQRTEEIERLLQDRTEFFAAVSHDLRTPLAVIRSQAMMMRSLKFAEQSPAEVAETIVASSNQLLTLINELLELSKAEAGRLDLDLEEVHIAEVVKDLRRTIDGLAQAGDLKVTISIPRDLPPVHADARRLREILLNLVDNAVKYTPPGGSVAVSASLADGLVTIFVHDNGLGIPADAVDRVFEPFYRVKGNQPQRGQASTGLGLALTKRFVEAHGGEISFESTAGAGSTFVFTLRPFVPTPDPASTCVRSGAVPRRAQKTRRS